jgi:hypothetical protein
MGSIFLLHFSWLPSYGLFFRTLLQASGFNGGQVIETPGFLDIFAKGLMLATILMPFSAWLRPVIIVFAVSTEVFVMRNRETGLCRRRACRTLKHPFPNPRATTCRTLISVSTEANC